MDRQASNEKKPDQIHCQ